MNILIFCLILICAKNGSSLKLEEYEEFKKKVEDKNIILRMGQNFQKSNIEEDKKVGKKYYYVGTFIEVYCVYMYILVQLFKIKYYFRLKILAQ